LDRMIPDSLVERGEGKDTSHAASISCWLRRAGRDLVMAAEWPRERRNCNTRHNCGGWACLSVTARDIRDIVIES
jgi:hypothetical protein